MLLVAPVQLCVPMSDCYFNINYKGCIRELQTLVRTRNIIEIYKAIITI